VLNYFVPKYLPQIYLDLEKEIDNSLTTKSNLLIVTLPGLGATHLFQNYLNNHPDCNINYLNSANQLISDKYNFLDLDLEQVINYFQQSTTQQKFAVVVNQPYLLDSSVYIESTLPKRFHKIFYLGAYNLADTVKFIEFTNPKINQQDSEKIYKLSSGIPRLTKFFCVNPELITQDIKEIISNPLLENILNPTILAISKTNQDLLTKLNIDLHNPLISHYLNKTTSPLNIKINFDLTFVENNVLNPNPINKIESQILNYLIQNNGSITREKIAELKWGQDSYDSFSDLAITKTMRRLRHKLKVYSLKPVPKTGYVITRKNAR
jgi:hypothetical protein